MQRIGALAGAAALLVVYACSGNGGGGPPTETEGPGGGGVGASSSSSGGAGSSGGGLDAAAGPTPSTTTITWAGSIGDGNNLLAGVSVCVLTSPSACTTTDSSGNFSIDLPSYGSGVLASLSGFTPSIWPVDDGVGFSAHVILRATTFISALEQESGDTTLGQTGAVMFFTVDSSGNALADVSVSATPAGKVAVWVDGGVDPTVTVTNGAGWGTIFGLPAGYVNLSLTAPGLTCAPLHLGGWPPLTLGPSVLAPVQAGTLTVVRVSCQ